MTDKNIAAIGFCEALDIKIQSYDIIWNYNAIVHEKFSRR
jgi:hypothetical protein